MTEHTKNWKMIDGNFIYSLNEQGHNRFSCSVQPGQDDNGKRITEKEVESVTAFIFRACNAHADLLAALRLCVEVMEAHTKASHLIEGFARRENREDRILKRVKAAIEKAEVAERTHLDE